MSRRPRWLGATAVAAVLVAGLAAPASAVTTTASTTRTQASGPVNIPPGDNLIVTAYFSDPAKTQLIGQQWHGCGQPAGSWGTLQGYRTLYFTPC